VTHDVEFAATCSDRCAMFFGGRIVSTGTPTDFFTQSSFYTTAVSRMTRGYYDNAVTLEDAEQLCRLNGRKE
ncbi:MAG: ABC transporter ATP-binding protein, partial [Ruminococcus sp.]|nr:ABC transporter ATP-binding protein [Ruminococcus sp.]